ncbi:alpha/beta fold hydrolase [Rhodococcus sp. NPDC058505]|uniref:alpha/beta fold hydrolase n=1 Tax=unclassified Rhodococcus (in: high G+C Gram-positive bacteria) TaxID=192944 RepID=UPI00364815AA
MTVGDYTYDVTLAGPAGGAPVVLLHGFPETAACWHPVLPALARAGFRLIAPNQRGYSAGARPAGVEHYAIDALGGDVLALLDHLELRSAHLVGHDWGAAVAWWTAANHPDRVRSLTAVSVPHPAAFGWALRMDDDQKARSRYIGVFRNGHSAEQVLLADGAGRLREIYAGVDPALVDEHVRVLTEPGALTAALSWYRAMGRDVAETPAVRVPTTYVWSDGDDALGRAGAEKCAEFVTGPYRFVELDSVNHWVPEQAPESLAAAIIARVEGVSA